MSNLSNNSVETVNAAATAIVTAESRVQPTSVQVCELLNFILNFLMERCDLFAWVLLVGFKFVIRLFWCLNYVD